RRWRRQEPAIDQVTLMSGGGKCVDELAPDLIAAPADVRPDRDDEILRTGSELAPQCIDGRHGHARDGTAPPGVHGRNGAARAIRHQERDTVRRAYRDR